eukprot:4560915-Amphidinium_carterae.1
MTSASRSAFWCEHPTYQEIPGGGRFKPSRGSSFKGIFINVKLRSGRIGSSNLDPFWMDPRANVALSSHFVQMKNALFTAVRLSAACIGQAKTRQHQQKHTRPMSETNA